MDRFKKMTIYFMSAGYIYIGIRHFIDPDFFLAIMPDYLPLHLEAVYLSGIFEILLGGMLLFKKYRKFAEKGTIPNFQRTCRIMVTTPGDRTICGKEMLVIGQFKILLTENTCKSPGSPGDLLNY